VKLCFKLFADCMLDVCSLSDVAFAIEAVVPVKTLEVVRGVSALGAQLLSSRLPCLLKRGLRQELDSEPSLIIKLICELDFEAHSTSRVGL